MPTNDPEFSSIRAYTDADLPRVLRELKRDINLLNMLAGYRLPALYRFAPVLARLVLRLVLGMKLVGVKTIFSLQERITGYYFFHMLESSVKEYEICGIEHVPKSGGALLISNHRDIILDPSFVDYALCTKIRTTARLATGDNLSSIPYAEHLMRLNKSFWVKRSESSPRKLLANLITLSRYIRFSIVEDGELVWLAQSEGRAKNGLDITDEAVLKMLKLADNKLDWSTTCEVLRPIPMSISYEYDPCDVAKATELVTLFRTGEQLKDDTASIVTSIVEPKGRVAICFGEVVGAESGMRVEELAERFDQAIRGNYRLFPSNHTALDLLVAGDQYSHEAEAIVKTPLADFVATRDWLSAKGAMEPSDAVFVRRVEKVADPLVRLVLLGMYANPCVGIWRLQR